MGYLSRFSGEIKIEPPIYWSKYKISKYLNTDDNFGYTSIVFRVSTLQQDTEYGEAITRKAIALVPVREEAYKGYDILSEINDVINSFPGHIFTGEIRAEGEDTGDIRRYVIVDNKVKEMKAEIIWPDGIKETR